MVFTTAVGDDEYEVDDDSFDTESRAFFTAQKQKGNTLPILFRQDFDTLVKAIKAAVLVSASTKVLKITLAEDSNEVTNDILKTATILICLINKTETDFDFEDADVLDVTTGTHTLDGIYPAGTVIKYLYN